MTKHQDHRSGTRRAVGLVAALAILLLTLNLAPVTLAQVERMQEDEGLWITIGRDAFEMLERRTDFAFRHHQLKAESQRGDIVLTRIHEADVSRISELMHDTFNRCSGFLAHSSREEGLTTLVEASRIDLLAESVTFPIDQSATVQSLEGALDKTVILSTIQSLSTNFNNRYYSHPSGRSAAIWIRDLWQGYAGSRSDVTVDLFEHSAFNQPSVILTITGATSPNEVVVLGGHLDSTSSGSSNPDFLAPGADDDASGIAVLSEVIRAAMSTGFVPDRTVKFMGYAAEEVGLRGSQDIAASFKNAGTNVVAVLQLDMTAFNGSVNDIALLTDFTDTGLTSFVGQLVDTYQPSLQWTTTACGYGCSDHASWANQGYPTVMPFEATFGQHNLQIHTTNDTVATFGGNADHALKFARLGAAFLAEVGLGSGGGGGGGGGNELENGVPRTGLSGAQGSEQFFTLEVPAGATNLNFQISGGSGDADLYVRFGAPPTTGTWDCRPYISGNNESCPTSPAQTGTYHVMIRAFSAFSGASLVGSFTEGGGGGGGSCSVSENFDGGAGGWTHSSSSTCTRGTFFAGVPSLQSNGGVTTQVGGDHTSGSGNAFFTAANSSAGSNDVDGGNCIALSPVYSVADSSDVSVWYFHGQRDAGDDAAGDFFRLEISTDGGSTWSTLASNGDQSQNAAWTEATTTVSAGASVRFRVQASDGSGPGDLVEAGIDDISICPN